MLVSFIATNTEEPRRPFIMLDANTGVVVDSWEGIHSNKRSAPALAAIPKLVNTNMVSNTAIWTSNKLVRLARLIAPMWRHTT